MTNYVLEGLRQRRLNDIYLKLTMWGNCVNVNDVENALVNSHSVSHGRVFIEAWSC